MTNTTIDWQAEADSLAAYLDSRGLALHEGLMLATWFTASVARELSGTDDETRAALAHFAEQAERLAGLQPPRRQ